MLKTFTGTGDGGQTFKWNDFLLHVGISYFSVLFAGSTIQRWVDVLDIKVQGPAIIAAVNAAAAFRRSPRLPDPAAEDALTDTPEGPAVRTTEAEVGDRLEGIGERGAEMPAEAPTLPAQPAPVVKRPPARPVPNPSPLSPITYPVPAEGFSSRDAGEIQYD